MDRLKHLPLCSGEGEKFSQYALNRQLGGPKSCSGRFEKEKTSCPYRDSKKNYSDVKTVVEGLHQVTYSSCHIEEKIFTACTLEQELAEHTGNLEEVAGVREENCV